MGIRLLSASTNPPDPSGAAEVSTGLVPVTHIALATQRSTGNDIARPDDTYVWSSSAGGSRANRIYGTPVDSESQGATGGEYVSGWGSIPPLMLTAAAHYLVYAKTFSVGNGQLIDVYA